MSKFDLSKIQVSGASGMDDFFSREPETVTPTPEVPVAVKTAGRIKVSSLADLSGFSRISAETLVHKSDRDLWSIQKEADGTLVIERMFDDSNKPLKG